MNLCVLFSVMFIGRPNTFVCAVESDLSRTTASFRKSYYFECHSGPVADAALDLQRLSTELNTGGNFEQ
ncbi:MAG: hypothetical protein P8K08_04660 [Fuerstiella sp.]|jgi:2-methylcitrate dehydratase PrpD|nr:hypothetical protein [Fuerstiella sp.]